MRRYGLGANIAEFLTKPGQLRPEWFIAAALPDVLLAILAAPEGDACSRSSRFVFGDRPVLPARRGDM